MRLPAILLAGAVALAAAGPIAAETFPARGIYEVIILYAGQERHTQEYVDASTRQAFEKFLGKALGVDRCRQRQIQIGNGSFRSSAICDTPDGDMHNIQVENTGSYSNASFSYSYKMYFFGKWAVQKVEARLIKTR